MTNDENTNGITEEEIRNFRDSAASLVALADRMLIDHFGMPREKRLLLSRRERRLLASVERRGLTNDAN